MLKHTLISELSIIFDHLRVLGFPCPGKGNDKCMNQHINSSSANFNKYINTFLAKKQARLYSASPSIFVCRLKAHLDSNFITAMVTCINKDAIILLL